jgi:hypothetical protein
MPTLRFHDTFTPVERKILSRTFHQNCRDLGISHRDASIDIRRATIPNPHALGAITKVEPDRYIVILNSKNDLMRSIFALGHEMVHFDQHTRGDMQNDHVRQLVFWKGKSFPAWLCESNEHYNHLPWEKEAAAKQNGLLENALRFLLPDERRLVCDTAIALVAA